jgi:hypothetical protein
MSARELLLDVIVQESKVFLQSQQAAGLFLCPSSIAILRMRWSFLSRRSDRGPRVLVSQGKQLNDSVEFAILLDDFQFFGHCSIFF